MTTPHDEARKEAELRYRLQLYPNERIAAFLSGARFATDSVRAECTKALDDMTRERDEARQELENIENASGVNCVFSGKLSVIVQRLREKSERLESNLAAAQEVIFQKRQIAEAAKQRAEGLASAVMEYVNNETPNLDHVTELARSALASISTIPSPLQNRAGATIPADHGGARADGTMTGDRPVVPSATSPLPAAGMAAWWEVAIRAACNTDNLRGCTFPKCGCNAFPDAIDAAIAASLPFIKQAIEAAVASQCTAAKRLADVGMRIGYFGDRIEYYGDHTGRSVTAYREVADEWGIALQNYLAEHPTPAPDKRAAALEKVAEAARDAQARAAINDPDDFTSDFRDRLHIISETLREALAALPAQPQPKEDGA